MTLPLWLQPEGDLPQESIPEEGNPPEVPLVNITERPLQPSYYRNLIPFTPDSVKLELDREANHLLIRHAGYPLPPYANLFSATLRFYWGTISTLGGELRAGQLILLDAVYPKNTVLIFQAQTPAAGASAPLIFAEVYYW